MILGLGKDHVSSMLASPSAISCVVNGVAVRCLYSYVDDFEDEELLADEYYVRKVSIFVAHSDISKFSDRAVVSISDEKFVVVGTIPSYSGLSEVKLEWQSR